MSDAIEPLTIRIDGRLDVATAAMIAERLRVAERDREIVIELAARVECDVVALSYVADAIDRCRVPVSVRGLSGHDARILQYLGVTFPTRTDSHRNE